MDGFIYFTGICLPLARKTIDVQYEGTVLSIAFVYDFYDEMLVSTSANFRYFLFYECSCFPIVVRGVHFVSLESGFGPNILKGYDSQQGLLSVLELCL